ncbi:MAG: 3-dehydroquinate synthase II [Proteobacteria bacterium]|nr:3-dehydroquinate synthase II [Pseudomonadota bacterium]MBU4011169.1 3-dehydroquinate synthase II [Pseudomonadota bacterium]MBU4036191.1 3-dehydroquinate synthase II [Pseudomonadota bacterium]
MRKIWVKADPWNKDIITTALEGGADGVLVPKGYSEKVKELGKIQTISEDGDLKTGKDVVFYKIKSGEDEDEIVKLSLNKKVILECTDWTVIPLENLIAKGANVIAQVRNYQEACTVSGILEKGVKHILFNSVDMAELKKTLSLINSETDKVSLQHAEIIEVLPVGMGDRVCVDTCTSMIPGQGMLVGNSSSALFLVHAETVENPYVSPRPFRVNAGAVHAYTRVPGGKTRYLSELCAGDQVYIADYKGNITTGIIGRLKIEKRPLLIIKALAGGKKITTILQNAETIRLTSPDGKPLSVVNLKKGDKVLVAIEESGRHFGHKIDESILEQ